MTARYALTVVQAPMRSCTPERCWSSRCLTKKKLFRLMLSEPELNREAVEVTARTLDELIAESDEALREAAGELQRGYVDIEHRYDLTKHEIAKLKKANRELQSAARRAEAEHLRRLRTREAFRCDLEKAGGEK